MENKKINKRKIPKRLPGKKVIKDFDEIIKERNKDFIPNGLIFFD